LTARGLFYADHGEPAKAAADFHAALNLFDDGKRARWQHGHDIDVAVAERKEVFEQLAALRPEDAQFRTIRMTVRLRRGDALGASADAAHLERLKALDPAPVAVALLRGDIAEFERLRSAYKISSNQYFAALVQVMAPNVESEVTEALGVIEGLLKANPNSTIFRLALGLAQYRAGQFSAAVATLESGRYPAHPWHWDCETWLLLAMAHHGLGQHEKARRYFDEATWFLKLHEEAAAITPQSSVFGDGKWESWIWLWDSLFYREAQQLIEGQPASTAPASTTNPSPAPAPSLPP
jgi:tetratricopeptide (TPR) repeat protein